MKVRELIALLQAVNQDSRVLMAYDGDMVVTKPQGVETMASEEQIGSCWYQVEVGDVVILSERPRPNLIPPPEQLIGGLVDRFEGGKSL